MPERPLDCHTCMHVYVKFKSIYIYIVRTSWICKRVHKYIPQRMAVIRWVPIMGMQVAKQVPFIHVQSTDGGLPLTISHLPFLYILLPYTSFFLAPLLSSSVMSLVLIATDAGSCHRYSRVLALRFEMPPRRFSVVFEPSFSFFAQKSFCFV